MADRTPEDVIVAALRESGMNYASTADRIMRELKLAGFEVIDMLGDVTREVADLVAEWQAAEDQSFDYLPPREHDMRAFGRIIPDESTEPRESEGCTCCQVSTESTRANEDECPSCGHLMRSHTREQEED